MVFIFLKYVSIVPVLGIRYLFVSVIFRNRVRPTLKSIPNITGDIMIDAAMIYSALILIVLLMVILSVPSIFLLSWTAFKQLKRYMFLRAMRGMDDNSLPPNLVEELNTVRTDIGYATLITEELEKVSSIRSPMFQAELAGVLIIIMAFVPGYEFEVLILMMVLLVLCIIAVIYGSRAMKAIGREYVTLLKEMQEKGEKANDNMYG